MTNDFDNRSALLSLHHGSQKGPVPINGILLDAAGALIRSGPHRERDVFKVVLCAVQLVAFEEMAQIVIAEFVIVLDGIPEHELHQRLT